MCLHKKDSTEAGEQEGILCSVHVCVCPKHMERVYGEVQEFTLVC